MGIFDGGMFDFNGDGKVDMGEQFMAFKIMEDVFREEEDEFEDEFDDQDGEWDDGDDLSVPPFLFKNKRPQN